MILLLVWLYGNALVLLVGAVVNVVIGDYHATDGTRDDDIEPAEANASRV